MDATIAAGLGGLAGLGIGAAAVLAARWSERSLAEGPPPEDPPLARGVGDVLAVLRSIAIVLDSSDAVVKASAPALTYGLVRHGELVHHELRHIARQVRRDGVIREAELDLARGPNPDGSVVMRVRVAPLGVSHVLVLAEDHTHARRVEEVRRDFVANVSHELKTPVGGISLLAEAVLDAKEDPEAVTRFAERIRVESTRLGRLVQEIVDLSRLQVADTLHEPQLVDIGAVVLEAVDRVRVAAEAKSIDLGLATERDLRVFGDGELLVTAVANLLTNAINYSEARTKVGIGARKVGETVEIAVTDQGQGIPAAEQERIFERFYRVDAARSRATGGTGLGLAIVKHVCANHGGEVTVWSEEGRGSTFTMRLPVAAPEVADDGDPAADPPPGVAAATGGEGTA
ncbi:two-component sensor histidine kinase [Phycicoccus endophyticus]|uniref:Sensor-like histidine kinase SenX3 n=1 Tax=Phycicoccus endophyticus TaxID=1690220 RepID=A0A7G9R1W7_9MICO|nr:ATP-binding protein [Phycicoccus endophyticus]NHI18606.1 two-component sensor histidine kinase [Phycicoccus endophyticus]QNN49592.1 two-component sensor histidine kinase [Phycicoccus endophyticus]GGL33126.1 two-component sensor histidine kinase [Phycicoccus endophyticus]